MVVNKITLKFAIRACCLEDTVTPQLLHYYVKKQEKKELEQSLLLNKKKEGMIIDLSTAPSCVNDDDEEDRTATTNTSPLTEPSALLLSDSIVDADEEEEGESNNSIVHLLPPPPPPLPLPASIAPPRPKRTTRRSSKQASIARLDARIEQMEYSARFKVAFKEATEAIAAKENGSCAESVPSLVAKLNRKYKLDGKRKLTRSTLYRAVQHGKVGLSPCKKGPSVKIPDLLLDVTATHSEVSQVGNGGELRGRDFKRLIGAAVHGTRYEGKFEVTSVWRKLREQHPEKLQAAKVATAEDARLRWTTYNNLQQWFDDAKADLLASGLAIDQKVLNENGELLSEIDFRSPHCGGDDVKRRIINMDETHHDLSITTEKGGPRSTMYHNPNLQRGYKRTVKAGRHVTGVYATNAAGEALPPMYIFDSSATMEKNFRVKVSWLEGLPTIEGRFGCPSRVESGSFFSVRSSGSMDDSLFNDYIERVVLPLYPNISRTASFDSKTGKCALTTLAVGLLLLLPSSRIFLTSFDSSTSCFR